MVKSQSGEVHIQRTKMPPEEYREKEVVGRGFRNSCREQKHHQAF